MNIMVFWEVMSGTNILNEYAASETLVASTKLHGVIPEYSPP
jgi:hypothetical protein